MVQVDETVRAKIRAALEQSPSAMTLQLARKLGVPEVEIVRAMPADRITALDAGKTREIIEALAAFGKVHVIVSNGATTLESFGEFGGFSEWGEFFNVQTKSLDMHIRWQRINDVFAVEKPGHMDGVNTMSVQFYDADGHAAFKAFLSFGGSAPAPERVAQFHQLRDQFRR
jgi:putative heme utilization carrier protein HutX